MDPVRQVNWLANREDFDRVVEALLQRMWSMKADRVAYATDGRCRRPRENERRRSRG